MPTAARDRTPEVWIPACSGNDGIFKQLIHGSVNRNAIAIRAIAS